MVERTGGKGGYGAIASDNTDQRVGRYHPHLNITKWENYSLDETQVACIDCGKRWHHPRRDPWGSAPEECREAT